MTDTANNERAKYHHAWSQPYYRTPSLGLQLWRQHREWFTITPRMVDIGCGRGHVLMEWTKAGIDAWGLDIADNCLDSDLVATDPAWWEVSLMVGPVWQRETWRGHTFTSGLCCDVMEHIPPAKVNATLRQITASCATTLFKIACFPNVLGPPDLHMTVKPPSWWVDTLSRYGILTVHRYDGDDVQYPYLVATLLN